MKKIDTLLIGQGNSFNYHLKTINHLPNLFDVVEKSDITLKNNSKYDLVVISNEDYYKKISNVKKLAKKNTNIVVEKPFFFDSQEIPQNDSVLFVAMHARYSSLLINLFTLIEKEEKIESIELVRLYPNSRDRSTYIINSSIYNALSEINLFGEHKLINEVSVANSEFIEDNLQIRGELQNTIKFKFHTDWQTENNQKMTTIYTNKRKFILDYSNQSIIIRDKSSDKILSERSYFEIGDRVEHEYIRMYLDIYDVINKIKPDNRNLIKKLNSIYFNEILIK